MMGNRNSFPTGLLGISTRENLPERKANPDESRAEGLSEMEPR